jgi:hypothetical protein
MKNKSFVELSKGGAMKRILVLATLLTILGFTTHSQAALLNAVPLAEGNYSSFQITFDDLNGDRLFTGLSELTSFSGVTIFTNN